MRKQFGSLVFSPTDLIRYLASPYASWMDRFYLEYPDAISPDADTADQALIAKTGIEHEQTVLTEFKLAASGLVEISTADFAEARKKTLAAITAKAPIVYQAALQHEQFAGFADFMILDGAGQYQVWDTKLARSPKPYYAIQLCCYSEMYAKATGNQMPKKFGIILGSKERVEFRVEDYTGIKSVTPIELSKIASILLPHVLLFSFARVVFLRVAIRVFAMNLVLRLYDARRV